MEKQRFPFQSLPDLKQSAVITGWGRVAAVDGVGGCMVENAGRAVRRTNIPLLGNRKAGQSKCICWKSFSFPGYFCFMRPYRLCEIM